MLLLTEIALPIIILTSLAAVLLRRTRWASLSLRISRWTYAVFVPVGLLYFPVRSGFRLSAPRCEWTFDVPLAVYSLRNWQHIAAFTIFFLVTYAQFQNARKAMVWSFIACITTGFLVELSQGVSSVHHCRMRDLIPDTAGAIAGVFLVIAGRLVARSRQKPPSSG